MFKVIIAGSRTFGDYELLKTFVDMKLSRIKEYEGIEIVSGGAGGADRLGEWYAKERGYSLVRFPAKWETMGLMAGPKRNREMALYADALIAFWDGESKGTQNMIYEARKQGLKVSIKRF